jgi:hypothetical protein
MTNAEPINPVTIRGYNGEGNDQRAVALGRLWIGSNTLADGPHKFDSKNMVGDLDKVMQFIIFEEITKLDVLTFMVGDENDFVKGMKELRQPGQRHFAMSGNPARGDVEKREMTFTKIQRQGDWWIVVEGFKGERSTAESVKMMTPWKKFDKGMDHLFPKGELLTPENN